MPTIRCDAMQDGTGQPVPRILQCNIVPSPSCDARAELAVALFEPSARLPVWDKFGKAGIVNGNFLFRKHT